jgi:hypothetical protein
MADNLRKLLDLTGTLFNDGQAARSITPQDLRDLMVTFRTQYMVSSMTTPATMTLTGGATKDTYALTDSLVASNGWSRNSAGSYNYDTAPIDSVSLAAGTRTFLALGICTCEMLTTISEVDFWFAKNGTAVASTIGGNNLTDAVLNQQVIFGGALVDLVATDDITVQIENLTDTDDITIKSLSTILIGMPE